MGDVGDWGRGELRMREYKEVRLTCKLWVSRC